MLHICWRDIEDNAGDKMKGHKDESKLIKKYDMLTTIVCIRM